MSTPTTDESLMREVAITLCGANGMVAVVHSFFDESYEDDRTFFVVAGYIFKTSKLRKFEKEWRAMIRPYPYFHMQELNRIKHLPNKVQVGGTYDGMTAEQADNMARKATDIIIRYAEQGFIVHVDPRELEADWEHKHILDDAYHSCVWFALAGVKIWRDSKAIGSRLAYFFESGGPNQKQVKASVERLSREDGGPLSESIYAFVPKGNAPACDAADMLSFLALSEFRRQQSKSNRNTRKDLLALTNGVPTEYAKIPVKAWSDSCISASLNRLLA